MDVRNSADFVQYLERLAVDKGVPGAKVEMRDNSLKFTNRAGQTHQIPVSEVEAAISAGNTENMAMQILSEHLV